MSSSSSSSSTASSFSLADDVPEDAGTAALLLRDASHHSVGIAAILQNNRELHDKVETENEEDAVAAASSHSAASPVLPLESVFQSTASLPRGGGHGLGGTLSRIVASQLEDNSPRFSHRSESYHVGVRASSGLDDDMLHTMSETTGDIEGPGTFAATAMGGPSTTAPDIYNDTFEEDDDEEGSPAAPAGESNDDDDDEAVIEREVQLAKAKIAQQAQRDTVEEDEYFQRRELEDAQRLDGWFGSNPQGISTLHDAFAAQTSLMEDEEEARKDVAMQQSSTWGALDNVIMGEMRSMLLSSLQDALRRWVQEEASLRAAIEETEIGEAFAVTNSYRLEAKQSILRHNEEADRRSLHDDWINWFEKAAAREVSDRQATSARQLWREQRSATLSAEQERSKQRLDDDEAIMFQLVQRVCNAVLTTLLHEQDAIRSILDDEAASHRVAECRQAARTFAASVEALFEDEQFLRKSAAALEWDGRRPLYDAHRKALMVIRPRKPAVPRLSRKICVPAPPERPHPVTMGGAWTATESVGRPKVLKVRPLPLRRLPPYEEPTAVAPSAGRASATSVDEAVGRKAITSREHHQWCSLLSSFRHTLHSIDHNEATTEEVSLSRAYRQGQGPFRVAECEYDRYKELKDDAKRRRAHNEERFRLQSLVSRLIAVDMEFEVKLAMKSSKQRATAVKEPRPPFQYSSVGAAAAKRCAWEVIPRIGVAATPLPNTTRRPAATADRNESRSPQRSPQRSSDNPTARQRPATAAAAQGERPVARPPQVPRTVQSARPPPRSPTTEIELQPETFGECLDRKLEEALSGVEADEPQRVVEAGAAESPLRRIATPSPESSYHASSRSSSSSSRSSSAASSISRRSSSVGSHASDRETEQNTRDVEQPGPEAVLDGTQYADDSFESTPASPDKSHNATTVAPSDDEADNAASALPAKEEVVHSLISTSAPSSKPPTPPQPQRGGESPERNRSGNSSRASSSSRDSWHPMETSGNREASP